MEELVKLFKALSDETRINILILVSKRNICQKGISRHLNISDSAVSQHIKILKDANIIRGYKEGYYVIYNINKDIFNMGIDFIRCLGGESSESIKKLDITQKSNIDCTSSCKSRKNCCMRREF